MILSMFLSRFEKTKILNRIIEFISVNMMNMFFLRKFSPKELFHYESMFSNIFSWRDSYRPIAILVKFKSTIPSWVIFSIPKSFVKSFSITFKTVFVRTWMFFVPYYSSLSSQVYFFATHRISKFATFMTTKFSFLAWIMRSFFSAIMADELNHGGIIA